MKIDDLNTVNAINLRPAETSPGKDPANVQPEKADVRRQDRVELSTRKTEIEKLSNTVADMPDVRAEKVAALKQRIDEGSYTVEGVKVAEKMIEHFKGMKDSGGTK